MRMWRNWQTRRFQVPVGNRMGSNPFIRTTKNQAESYRFDLFFAFYVVPFYIVQGRYSEETVTAKPYHKKISPTYKVGLIFIRQSFF